jgi:hypothetical protein
MYFNEYGISLDAEELRDILTGKIGFRKCPDCEDGEFFNYLQSDYVKYEEDMYYD